VWRYDKSAKDFLAGAIIVATVSWLADCVRPGRHEVDTIATISKRQNGVAAGGSDMSTSKWIIGVGAAMTLLSLAALAQAPKPDPSRPAPGRQEPVLWERMPRMQLEAEYGGPMRDTIIQRWRDPGGNVVCYLYVPFTAQHSAPTPNGYVQYGANIIGTISCVPVLAAAPAKPAAPSARVTPPHTPANPR
jgi:hypothetical protein